MARQSGVVPYKTAQRLVSAGLMPAQALTDGMENGTIARPAASRDYGQDQEVYEAIQRFVDECNESAVEYIFSVMGRSKVTETEGK